jgi:hypothetical protein
MARCAGWTALRIKDERTGMKIAKRKIRGMGRTAGQT